MVDALLSQIDDILYDKMFEWSVFSTKSARKLDFSIEVKRFATCDVCAYRVLYVRFLSTSLKNYAHKIYLYEMKAVTAICEYGPAFGFIPLICIFRGHFHFTFVSW